MAYEFPLVPVMQLQSVQLEAFYEQGDPVRVPYQGRPDYAVTSCKPLEYERYGWLRNRAPVITGPVAVRGMIISEDRNPFTGGLKPGFVFEARDQFYADLLIPQSYSVLQQALLNRVAAATSK